MADWPVADWPDCRLARCRLARCRLARTRCPSRRAGGRSGPGRVRRRGRRRLGRAGRLIGGQLLLGRSQRSLGGGDLLVGAGDGGGVLSLLGGRLSTTLGQRQVVLGGRQVVLGRRQRGLGRTRVELAQHLSGVDPLAESHVDRGDRPAGGEAHVLSLVRSDVPARGHRRLDVAQPRRHGADGGMGRRLVEDGVGAEQGQGGHYHRQCSIDHPEAAASGHAPVARGRAGSATGPGGQQAGAGLLGGLEGRVVGELPEPPRPPPVAVGGRDVVVWPGVVVGGVGSVTPWICRQLR